MSGGTAGELEPYLEALRSSAAWVDDLVHRLPGSAVVFRYIKSSHQDDPFRTLLELLLVFFVIRTWRQSRTKGDTSGGKHFIKFTEREVDELVNEWQPEPLIDLAAPTADAARPRPPILMGRPGIRSNVVVGEAARALVETGDEAEAWKHAKPVLNLSGINFAGLVGDERVNQRAITQLKRSGVGSCGPPGFYGTFGRSPSALPGAAC